MHRTRKLNSWGSPPPSFFFSPIVYSIFMTLFLLVLLLPLSGKAAWSPTIIIWRSSPCFFKSLMKSMLRNLFHSWILTGWQSIQRNHQTIESSHFSFFIFNFLKEFCVTSLLFFLRQIHFKRLLEVERKNLRQVKQSPIRPQWKECCIAFPTIVHHPIFNPIPIITGQDAISQWYATKNRVGGLSQKSTFINRL